MFKELLETFKAKKHIFISEGELYILAFLPYKLYVAEQHEVFIDPYLYYSNLLYHKMKGFITNLTASGYVARRASEVAIKSLMLRLNLGKIGINQLFISDHGSRCVYAMCAVTIDENTRTYLAERKDIPIIENLKKLESTDEDVKAYAHDFPDFCKNCLLCKKACPTGAIGEKLFDATKCIRHIQDAGRDISVRDAVNIGNKFLGCDICMNACPYNKTINNKVAFDNYSDVGDIENLPKDAEKMYRLEVLFEHILNKEKRDDLAAVIGKNYVRVGRLLFLALAIYDNINAEFPLPQDKIAEYADERILELIKKIQNKINSNK